jgi:hypothetical protein
VGLAAHTEPGHIFDHPIFATYGDTGGRGLAAMAPSRYSCLNGRNAWLFSDTYVGAVNADHSVPTATVLVNNAVTHPHRRGDPVRRRRRRVGSSIVTNGGYTYVYGTELTACGGMKVAKVARVTAGSLSGAWQRIRGTLDDPPGLLLQRRRTDLDRAALLMACSSSVKGGSR